MLNVNKSITLNGRSEIDGQVVVYMSAALSTDGTVNDNINKNISNRELYKSNLIDVRKDMDEFEKCVRDIEDSVNNGEVLK